MIVYHNDWNLTVMRLGAYYLQFTVFTMSML